MSAGRVYGATVRVSRLGDEVEVAKLLPPEYLELQASNDNFVVRRSVSDVVEAARAIESDSRNAQRGFEAVSKWTDKLVTNLLETSKMHMAMLAKERLAVQRRKELLVDISGLVHKSLWNTLFAIAGTSLCYVLMGAMVLFLIFFINRTSLYQVQATYVVQSDSVCGTFAADVEDVIGHQVLVVSCAPSAPPLVNTTVMFLAQGFWTQSRADSAASKLSGGATVLGFEALWGGVVHIPKPPTVSDVSTASRHSSVTRQLFKGVVVIMAVLAIVVPTSLTLFWLCQVCRAEGTELALSLVRTMLPSGRGCCCINCGPAGRWLIAHGCSCCCRAKQDAADGFARLADGGGGGGDDLKDQQRTDAVADLQYVAAVLEGLAYTQHQKLSDKFMRERLQALRVRVQSALGTVGTKPASD